jgi:hypothetical protein
MCTGRSKVILNLFQYLIFNDLRFRSKFGMTLWTTFDTAPGSLMCEEKQEDGVVKYSVIPSLWKLKISTHS